MPSEIHLVKVGMTMTEGTVEEWYVADGATVASGDLLYRLETEKVNLDVDAEAGGTVKHLAATGATLEPGAVIGFIYAPGETIPATLPQGTPRQQADTAAAPAAPSQAAQSASEAAAGADDAASRRPASPAARKLASELGVDLAGLAGSGPRGRITRADIEQAAQAAKAPAAAGLEAGAQAAPATKAPAPAAAAAPAQQAQPLKGMRRTIAQRMRASLANTAQLTLDMEVRMDDAVRLREQLATEWEAEGVRPGYTDLVMLAAAKALIRHPRMNAALLDDAIVPADAAHVGMAVALDEGLVVPVIRDAAAKGLKALASESATLADRARAGALTLADVQGGTFTVTSLGMYGVDGFTPILNAPQTGILGVGRIYDGVAWQGDVPVRRRFMRLSLTWDHRVLDGAPAAQFLAEVRDYLEAPYRLLG